MSCIRLNGRRYLMRLWLVTATVVLVLKHCLLGLQVIIESLACAVQSTVQSRMGKLAPPGTLIRTG